MFDAIDPSEGLEDSVEDRQHIRRARLIAQGRIGEHLGAKLKLQWEFSDSEEELLEGLLDWHTFPVGSLRLGHFREPFGFDAKTSSGHQSFLERSAPTDAFTPGRNRGVQVRDLGRDWSLAAGFFRSADDVVRVGGQETAITARGTWLPMRSEDDHEVLHLGLSISERDFEGDGLRLSARPSARLV
ncbi:MAG: porin, partial [Planctomycetota bacterium]|nr:porin [Planctomycetota bacterium]